MGEKELPFSADSNVTSGEEAVQARKIFALMEEELGENATFTLLWDTMEEGKVNTRVISNADRGYRLIQLMSYLKHERNKVEKKEESSVNSAN